MGQIHDSYKYRINIADFTSFINELRYKEKNWFKGEYIEMILLIYAKLVSIQRLVAKYIHWARFICTSMDMNHLHYSLFSIT